MEFTREQLIAWIRGNVGGDEANAIAAMLEEDAKFRAVVYRLEAEHRDCEPGPLFACSYQGYGVDRPFPLECPNCAGEGVVEDDCGEDTCCCADDHGLITCPSCRGTGVRGEV